jgi:tetratricopeptide (TPR) repeat protein
MTTTASYERIATLVRRYAFDFDAVAASLGSDITPSYCRQQFAVADLHEQKVFREFSGKEYAPEQLKRLESLLPDTGSEVNEPIINRLSTTASTIRPVSSPNLSTSVISSSPPPLTGEQKVLQAIKLKECGNKHFAGKDYNTAVQNYTDAIDLLTGMLALKSGGMELGLKEEQHKQLGVKEALAVLHSNRANVHLLLNNYREALDDTDSALVYDKGYVKAMVRKASALCGVVEHGQRTTSISSFSVAVRAYSMACDVLTRANDTLSQQQQEEQQKDNAEGCVERQKLRRELHREQQLRVAKQREACSLKLQQARVDLEAKRNEKNPDTTAVEDSDDTKSDSDGSSDEEDGGEGAPEFLRTAGMDEESVRARGLAAENSRKKTGDFKDTVESIMLEDWHFQQHSQQGKQHPYHWPYRWKQTFDEMQVVFPMLPAHTKSHDVRVEFGSQTLAVKAHGDTLLSDGLMGRVRLDECVWELQDADTDVKLPAHFTDEVNCKKKGDSPSCRERELVVTLSKAVTGDRYDGDLWQGVVTGTDAVDVAAIAVDQQHLAVKMRELNRAAKQTMRGMLPKSLTMDLTGPPSSGGCSGTTDGSNKGVEGGTGGISSILDRLMKVDQSGL